MLVELLSLESTSKTCLFEIVFNMTYLISFEYFINSRNPNCNKPTIHEVVGPSGLVRRLVKMGYTHSAHIGPILAVALETGHVKISAQV